MEGSDSDSSDGDVDEMSSEEEGVARIKTMTTMSLTQNQRTN